MVTACLWGDSNYEMKPEWCINTKWAETPLSWSKILNILVWRWRRLYSRRLHNSVWPDQTRLSPQLQLHIKSILGTNSWLLFWRTGNTNGSLEGFPKVVKSPETLGHCLWSLLLRREADEAERLDAQGRFSKTSTVQKKQLWFVVYLRSVVPDFLFPARRCLGLRSNTCRSDSPFLPWRFMSFWEFFIIFLAFFTI